MRVPEWETSRDGSLCAEQTLPFHPQYAVTNTLALSLTGRCALANGTQLANRWDRASKCVMPNATRVVSRTGLNGSRWDQSALCQMQHMLYRVLASTDRAGVTAVKEGIL